MSITYPQPLPAGAQLQKYGPAVSGAAATWFSWGTFSPDRLKATYQVIDNGTGDSNITAVGVIEDPFAPVLLAVVPGGATSIPTLSEWGMVMMSLLLGGLAWFRLRRRLHP